ncbi:ketopantoate reductase family protein [Methylomonas rosea]|uniref:2-dehydropantoate 2-reductase n=1 Tax=Methylomonas rosea TaxID=2952227 RepID=A0ABT1TMM6_9GAMM|nr:2-dehydropantoate 2-reductase [Methylomonas sp. WSC-7]MCQ8116016.1 2-dehydropantoate 2-reductase [Methylomonas sp. WSC-7]
MNNKVLIVGAGAIGGFYGGLLAKADADVSVVCRSDYDVVQQQGYRIESHALGSWQFTPSQVLRDAADYNDQADYLILCSKVTPDIDRVALIRDAVAPHTAIVLIQNGVEIEQELQQAFPDNLLISGLAFICCNRNAPAEISHLAYGKLILGNLSDSHDPKTLYLRDLFLRAGIECEISDDIIASRWQKCVWNAPFNPLSVLSGGLATQAILQNQENFVRRVMQEVCSIADACSHPLPADIVENHIALTRDMPPYKTSMLLDFERGHTMETEAILGNAVRAAKRQGVDCPCLQSLYVLMQLRELQIRSNSLLN